MTERTLPALPTIPRGILVLAAMWALFLVAPDHNARIIFDPWLRGAPALDWELYTAAGQAIAAGQSPYQAESACLTCSFRHSPVVAWAFVAIEPLGLAVYRLLHVAALIALPPALGLLVLASWPFWMDVAMGQPMTFALVLAFLAVRGNRWAGVGFLMMATLMPRPLMLPVAAWLLWKQPGVRLPFLAISAVHLLVALPWLGEWSVALAGGITDLDALSQVGPSRFIGAWWVVVGLPLAAWFTLKGRLGLASLAASPYWFGYYLLMAFLEVTLRRTRSRSPSPEPRSHRSLPSPASAR